jgi:hypothetical protein
MHVHPEKKQSSSVAHASPPLTPLGPHSGLHTPWAVVPMANSSRTRPCSVLTMLLPSMKLQEYVHGQVLPVQQRLYTLLWRRYASGMTYEI